MKPSSVSEFKRIAGLTEDYGTWTRKRAAEPAPKGKAVSLAEARRGAAPEVSPGEAMTLEKARIHHMAGSLSEVRGGTHLPMFEWPAVRRMMKEAETHPAHELLKNKHWNARFASANAHEADKAGDAAASHKFHSSAAQQHHDAAQHMFAAGDHEMGKIHAAWAQHHSAHAAHSASRLGGGASAHKPAAAPTSGGIGTHVSNAVNALADKAGHAVKGAATDLVKKAAGKLIGAPAEKGGAAHQAVSAVADKVGSVAKNMATGAAKGLANKALGHGSDAPGATVHMKPGMQAGPAPTKPAMKKKDLPGYEGVHPETQGHVAGAHQSSGVAAAMAGDPNASHTHLAGAHKQASNDHLHAALSLFHGGHHDKALDHFNAAIHHGNKAAGHQTAIAAANRPKAEPGPRAATGHAHV